MQIELLPRIVQFEIDTGITLDVEGQLFGISPFAVTPAVLAITHRFLPVYDTYLGYMMENVRIELGYYDDPDENK